MTHADDIRQAQHAVRRLRLRNVAAIPARRGSRSARNGVSSSGASAPKFLSSINGISNAVVKSVVNDPLDDAVTFHTTTDGESNISFAAYTIQSLHNLYMGTGDTDYWTKFKTLITGVKALATSTATRDGSSSVFGSGPLTSLGADYSTYLEFPNAPTKSIRMLAMSTLHFLYDVIRGASGLGNDEVLWAETQYEWFHRHVIERLVCSPGTLQNDGTRLCRSAILQQQGIDGTDTGHTNGYWSSQAMLHLITVMLWDLIRVEMGRSESTWFAQESTYDDPQNPGNDITTPRFDYMRWFRWWVASTTTDNGCLQWDTTNPHINVNEGFGANGENQAPDTDHSWRIVRAAQVVSDYGLMGGDAPMVDADDNAITLNQVLDRIGNTFDQKICLQTDVNQVRLANYIDGVDTSFRGLTHSGGGVDGMSSYTWGWYHAAKHDDGAYTCFSRLLDWLHAEPNLSTGNARYGGTYQVHNTDYGIPHVYGAMYDIDQDRGT